MAVIGKVKSVQTNEKGAIIVGVDFIVDGVPDPQDFKTYFWEDIKNLTPDQFLQKIKDDIVDRCNQITYVKYKYRVGEDPLHLHRKQLADTYLSRMQDKISNFIGQETNVPYSTFLGDDGAHITVTSDGKKVYGDSI